jgi:hypothetical protein
MNHTARTKYEVNSIVYEQHVTMHSPSSLQPITIPSVTDKKATRVA